ncbi:MAG: aldehyde dehydrogenase family protein, partial [Anaerolineales bacterium]|nr:aldehyde dehydrogenase family protein [Anaerolineales bacterium]
QIQKHSRLFAVLETMDNGKPIRETRDIDIPLVARHFYHHAGWAQLMSSEMKGYQSLGVVGQIIPWNFPLLMLSWKIAPALAMGNTVVLKPAEFTSLTALLFAEICEKILPAGVVNIITGDGRTGAALVNADVDKIAFTGSTDVGRIIRKATAGTAKKLSLELGGKSPFIVFDDADLDSAVEGVVDAIWCNQGQVCCAGSRLLVQEGVAEKMYKKLKARMEKLRVGDPLDKAVDIGAIVAPVQLQRIEELVKQGQDEGADMWQPSWSCPTDGYFYPPTLFTNVAPASTIAQVEIFGPVLAAMTFRTPEEAVKLANNTRFGLAACIWSEDINLALDIATQIKAGTIWINSTNLFDAASGFGGYRESGFGREGGKEGLFEYVKKTVDSGRQTVKPKAAKSNGHKRSMVNGLSSISIDRTAKLFINGKQARPDSGYSIEVKDVNGNLIAEVGAGNRKDIRNAVEAARGIAEKWFKTTGHNKAQILYYLGENLAARADEFSKRIVQQTGVDLDSANQEVEGAIEALFTAAAWADKYDGAIHNTPIRNVTLAVPEAIGVMAILLPDDKPLLALCQLTGTALAMGNALVVVPSPVSPLSATDFYQVLETSDVPAGTINIVTGNRDELAKTLSEHDDVDVIWYAGEKAGVKSIQAASAGNMKQTWVMSASGELPEMDEILRHATQVKNIWVPYGA